jgi:two-component system, chemotaxis family, chemotaxis protein CheY
MIDLDDETQEYLAECSERLATVETDLLDMEKAGADINEELVNRAYRAVHSVVGAGFYDLVKIGELAHQMEDVLARIRSRTLVPTPNSIRVLLLAKDRLLELIQKPGASNQADIAEIVAALGKLRADFSLTAGKSVVPAARQNRPAGWRPRVLLAEDDFASRLLLQTFLSRYGECHIAVNGREAVEAFRSALEQGQSYDLICMDIMMPEMNGREAVRQIRALEAAHGIFSSFGAKIIMTTAMNDIKEVIRCYQELCDAYLVKPIDLIKLLSKMQSYQLAP